MTDLYSFFRNICLCRISAFTENAEDSSDEEDSDAAARACEKIAKAMGQGKTKVDMEYTELIGSTSNTNEEKEVPRRGRIRGEHFSGVKKIVKRSRFQILKVRSSKR